MLVRTFDSFRDKIDSVFKWKKPYALPSKRFGSEANDYTWEDWTEETSKKYPLRYFFHETMMNKIDSTLHRIDRAYYEAKAFVLKYHMLDLRQPKGSPFDYRNGYRDIVEKIIFANFNLLCTFVEKELGGVEKATEFLEQIKKHSDAKEQAEHLTKTLALYSWWKNEMPKMYDDVYNSTVVDYIAYGKKLEEFEELINAKLKEVIDLRRGLWT